MINFIVSTILNVTLFGQFVYFNLIAPASKPAKKPAAAAAASAGAPEKKKSADEPAGADSGAEATSGVRRRNKPKRDL